ncbi:MAG: cohesin domain-containing protein [Candidatus Hydrogenedentota bacterium]
MFLHRRNRVSLIGCAAFVLLSISAAAQTTLTIGTVQGEAGSRVTVPVTIANVGVDPTIIIFFIDFDGAALTFVEGEAGDAVPEGKIVDILDGENAVAIAIFGLNLDPILDGTLVTLTFDIAAGATGEIVLEGRQTSSATDAEAQSIGLALIAGSIGLICGDLPAPQNVQAGDDDPDGVHVTWNAVTSATEYRVFRNTTDQSASSSAVSAWLTETEFFDESAAGLGGGGGGCAQPSETLTLFYWVVARSASECESQFSASDTGSVFIAPAKLAGVASWPHAVADLLMIAFCLGAVLQRKSRFVPGPRAAASQ